MRLLLLPLILILMSCSEEPAPAGERSAASPPTPAAADLSVAEEETRRLNDWLDAEYEESLDFSPMTRTILGDKTDYDQLNDYSEAAETEELQWLRESVAEMESRFDFESLTEEGQLSYTMWAFSLEQAEAAYEYRNHGYIFGRGGPQSSLPSFMISFHRIDTAEDAEAYVSRLREIEGAISELLDRARSASADGIRQPEFAYDYALQEVERVTAGVPFSSDDDTPNSPIWADFQGKLEALVDSGEIDSEQAQDYLQEAEQILSGPVLDAYQELAAWLEEDRSEASAEAQGVWALPQGEDYYAQRLKLMTTLELSADEIHEIGLAEVDRLLDEMEAVKEEAGFEGTLQEFFVFMREDEQFYYPNTEEGRQDYLAVNEEYLAGIEDKLPDYFGRLPKAPLVVRRVESFREQPGAAQHYRQGAPDGSRPGVFYSHMSDMSSLAKWQIEDIAYHEGNPGHHMQISIQQELTEVPRFRTQYRTTAYTEGWGLYAEWLAKEMGGFEDPYSEFGRLAGEMWRAIRLVVDTGIHAKQWSEQEAIDYFLDNSPIPESAVRSEVERYFANPGQATAYKIGMMNIQQARIRAEEALGDDFDVRGFHDVVLGAGAVPLPIMHQRVDRWIRDEGGTPRQARNQSAALTPAEPEAVGMSSAGLERVTERLQQHIEDGDIPGVVAAVARDNRLVYFEALGEIDIESGTPMPEDALFRIYSMTRQITSVAVLQLHEQGAFELDDPVSDYLPEFANPRVLLDPESTDTSQTRPAETEMTIAHLLTHTSGLGSRSSSLYRENNVRDRNDSLDEMVSKAASVPLFHDPGTEFLYGIHATILGKLVELASGQPFDEYLEEHLFEPLGMDDTLFWAGPEDRDRLARVYRPTDGRLQPYAIESVPWTERPGLIEGGVGLLSTTMDFMRFSQMVLNRGELDGVRVLRPETAALIYENGVPDEAMPIGDRGYWQGSGWTLGGFNLVMDAGAYNFPVSEGTIWWDGSAATRFFINPEQELVMVIMSQVSPSSGGGFRENFKRLVDEAVVQRR